MRHAEGAWHRLAGVLLGLLAGLPALAVAAVCTRPVYLTFDTGHMGVAPLVAQVLRDADVKATFFLANERTQTGGWSLDEQWAPWWRGMTAAGHAFGSHTWDHHTWLADRPDGGFDTRPSMGPNAGKRQVLSAAAYCAELQRPADRFQAITGQAMLPLFRAPGGKTSPALLQAARGCGWQHVGWAPAGFLGDELPSDKFPNDQLLKKALAGIRAEAPGLEMGVRLSAFDFLPYRADPARSTPDNFVLGLRHRFDRGRATNECAACRTNRCACSNLLHIFTHGRHVTAGRGRNVPPAGGGGRRMSNYYSVRTFSFLL
jgi:peptidoglycan/xylan/chitin deacetylase (PgdA/CDA1 family)